MIKPFYESIDEKLDCESQAERESFEAFKQLLVNPEDLVKGIHCEGGEIEIAFYLWLYVLLNKTKDEKDLAAVAKRIKEVLITEAEKQSGYRY